MANSIAKLAIMLTTDTSGMMKGFAAARAQTKQFAGSMNGAAGFASPSGGLAGMSGLFGKIPPQAAIAAAAVAGLGIAAKKTYDALTPPTQWAADLEQSQASFRVMMGSAKAAGEMMGSLKGLSLNFGLDGNQLADNAKLLMSFGVESKQVASTLRQIGDIAMGDAQRMQTLSLAFAQSQAAGRLMGQDLLQMVNAGFNPLEEISRKTGETMLQLKARMEAGGISSREVADAFASATAEGGRWNGMLKEMASTWDGEWRTMTAQLKEMMIPLGKTIIHIIKPAIHEMNEQLREMLRMMGSLPKDLDKSRESAKGLTEESQHLADIQKDLDLFKSLGMSKPDPNYFKEFFEESQRLKDRLKQDQLDDGKRLAESLMTPQEKFAADAEHINDLFRNGAISAETFRRAMARAREELHRTNNEAEQFDMRRGNAALSRNSSAAFSAIQEARQQQTMVAEAANRPVVAAINEGNRRLDNLARIMRESGLNVTEVDF